MRLDHILFIWDLYTLPKKVLIKHRLMKRCNKYINRGFEIVNIQELDSLD